LNSYFLTPSAQRDLDEIHDYVAAGSPSAAEQLMAEIEGAIERLAQFPRSGHLRTGLMPAEVRFWVVDTYLVVYRADETPIEILRIVSGFRDLVEELAWGVSEAAEEAMVFA